MSEPRSDGRYEVPVRDLAGGRGEGRRGTVAVVVLVAILGTAFALARLSETGSVADRSPAPDTAVAGASASALPTSSRGVQPEARVERVLDVRDRALAGAPTLQLVAWAGRDLRFVEWVPGRGLRDVRTVSGAVEDGELAIPVAAPVGGRIALIIQETGGGTDAARIVDGRGRVLWTGTEIAGPSGALWSADGSLAVFAGTGRRWIFVAVSQPGTSDGDTAGERVVDLPGDVFLPLSVTTGSITLPRTTPRTVPVGFSTDNRWIYGAIVSPELGIVIGEFRVRTDGSQVERVLDFGVGRPDGLAPRPGTIGGRLVDPTSGRVANWRINPDSTAGAPILEVRRADSSFAFTVPVGTPLGSAWDDDGSLVVLSADAPLFADSIHLARVGPDGSLEPPLLETGPLTGAGLIDVRGGWAAVLLWASRPAPTSQLVLVDLADPSRIAATQPSEDQAVIVGGALRP
jgi:hypothetical protein